MKHQKVKKYMGHRYEVRTESATVPITFTNPEEVKRYLDRMEVKNPFFHSLLKVFYVEVFYEEEQTDV